MNQRPHPNVYLEFGFTTDWNKPVAGRTDLHVENSRTGSCRCAAWMHYIGRVAVVIMFAVDGERREGLKPVGTLSMEATN
jgi:hypothetical protein